MSSIDFTSHKTLQSVNVLAVVGYALSSVWAALSVFVYYGDKQTVISPGIDFVLLQSIISIPLIGFAGYQFFDHAQDIVRAIGYRFAFLALSSALFNFFFGGGAFQLAFVLSLAASYYSTQIYAITSVASAASTGLALYVRAPFSALHAWSLISVPLSAFSIFTEGRWPSVPGLVAAVIVVALLLALSAFYAFNSRRGDALAGAIVAWYLIELIFYRRPDVLYYAAIVGSSVSGLCVVKSVVCSLYFAGEEGAIKLSDDDERAQEAPAAEASV